MQWMMGLVMVKETKKEAIDFLKRSIENMKGHGYKKLKEEKPEYTHKREHYEKTLKRWQFLLKAARGFKDEK